jgi:hypothetical protein
MRGEALVSAGFKWVSRITPTTPHSLFTHRLTRNCLRDETGSLSLFIISLFLLTMVLSFAIIDLSGAYLAQRQLINIGESAISRAAHSVDLDRYYSGDRVQSGSSVGTPTFLLPIDCSAAAQTLEAELTTAQLHGAPISIAEFRCEGDVLHTTLTSQIQPTLSLPLLPASVMSHLLTINATVSASNVIGG